VQKERAQQERVKVWVQADMMVASRLGVVRSTRGGLNCRPPWICAAGEGAAGKGEGVGPSRYDGYIKILRLGVVRSTRGGLNCCHPWICTAGEGAAGKGEGVGPSRYDGYIKILRLGVVRSTRGGLNCCIP